MRQSLHMNMQWHHHEDSSNIAPLNTEFSILWRRFGGTRSDAKAGRLSVE